MALAINEVQLTQLFISPDGTPAATLLDIEDATTGALLTALEVVGTQSIGATSVTKGTTEFSSIDANDVSYSQGSLSIAPKDISVLFNSADVAGQAEFKTIFADNTKRVFICKLTDGSYETFTGFSTKSEKSYEKGSAYMYNATIQPTTVPVDVTA